MRTTMVLGFCIFLVFLPHDLLGQTDNSIKDDHSVARVLAPTKKIVSKEVASLIDERVKCDSEGSIYYSADRNAGGTDELRKLNPKGERVAEFRPGANPNMPIDLFSDFTITPDGEVFMLVFPHELTRYIFVYKSDGSYRSSIKLETGFPWVPTAFAVFPSGGFLISGAEYAKNDNGKMTQVPFTGVFSADGRLLKQLDLEDDEDIVKFAATGDPRMVSASGNNRAISFTKMEAGDDGNIYLMRWTNPVIVYAISPGGSVVRRFLVDPKDSGYRPGSMHIAGNRIAVLFTTTDTKADIIKVSDLEGHPIGTYTETVNEKTDQRIGAGFACYTNNPEQFMFLSFGENNQLGIETVEPR